MISIHNLDDLKPFGIYALTGEACRVGTRILCDLTPDAEKIVADLFGLNYVTFNKYRTFAENWNSTGGASASFMMPDGLFADLAAWCLIHKGCSEIIRSDDGVHGREADDNDGEWRDLYEHLGHYKHRPRLIRNKTNLPGEGTRCTHAMSGRAE